MFSPPDSLSNLTLLGQDWGLKSPRWRTALFCSTTCLNEGQDILLKVGLPDLYRSILRVKASSLLFLIDCFIILGRYNWEGFKINFDSLMFLLLSNLTMNLSFLTWVALVLLCLEILILLKQFLLLLLQHFSPLFSLYYQGPLWPRSREQSLLLILLQLSRLILTLAHVLIEQWEA